MRTHSNLLAAGLVLFLGTWSGACLAGTGGNQTGSRPAEVPTAGDVLSAWTRKALEDHGSASLGASVTAMDCKSTGPAMASCLTNVTVSVNHGHYIEPIQQHGVMYYRLVDGVWKYFEEDQQPAED